MSVHLLQSFSCPKATLTTTLYQRTPPLPTHEKRTWGDSHENTWWMKMWSRIWENQIVLFSSQVCLWLFWEMWSYKLQRQQLTARWQLDTFLLWDYAWLFCLIHPGTQWPTLVCQIWTQYVDVWHASHSVHSSWHLKSTDSYLICFNCSCCPNTVCFLWEEHTNL